MSGGVNAANLRLLKFSGNMSSERAAQQIPDSPPVKFALINAQSLSNKTFILNDNFTSRQLDFLFVTETWLNVDLTSLGDLCPSHCSFLNSPRTTGCYAELCPLMPTLLLRCNLLRLMSLPLSYVHWCTDHLKLTVTSSKSSLIFYYLWPLALINC